MQSASRRKTASRHRRPRRPNVVTYTLTTLAAGIALSLAAPAANAAHLKVLHSFCPSGSVFSPCSDGLFPAGHLVMDGAGNDIYGTTTAGGANGTSSSGGIVFELIPNAAKTRWKEKVLYNFCTAVACADGNDSQAGLLVGDDGNLYGTTESGGANNQGTVFELIPNADKTKWKEKVLYSFCAAANCADGAAPETEVIADQAGNLYGTTTAGGGANGKGIVFELIPNAAKNRWHEKVLYSFCPAVGDTTCADGALPEAALLAGDSGILYGTTSQGGANGGGTVFELVANAAQNRWHEKVLYSFCSAADCVDGKAPNSTLVKDDAGDLIGTTLNAASLSTGTVFELVPNTAQNRWHERVIYTFCALADCTDGQQPNGPLVIDDAGLLYGTTQSGGADDEGTAFVLKPNGARNRWREGVLASFCNSLSCGGSEPMAGVIKDTNGNLYGTTSIGPILGAGSVFELKLR